VPKQILKEGERKRESSEAFQKRLDNKRKHSAPGSVPFESVRKKHIVEEQE
jgi:hypothetical protein